MTTDILSVPKEAEPRITGVTFNWPTHILLASGSDNWPLTWADDDHQYTSWGDGGGFNGTDSVCRVSIGVGRVEGPKDSFSGVDLWGDPSPGCALYSSGGVTGKTRTIICIDGVLYLWRSPSSGINGLDYQHLQVSHDHGQTFTDGGVEFTYAAHALGLFAQLQFGKDYSGARDGYVYIYAANIVSYVWDVQVPGSLYLLRVPKDQMTVQSAYEFVTGIDAANVPTWGAFADRIPVFQDAAGLMRSSACYNPWLKRYLLVTNHTQVNKGNVAIWQAPEPWGPWSNIVHYLGWPSGGEVLKTTFFANFSPKWWSNLGRDFVLCFTGNSTLDSFNTVEGSFIVEP